VYSQLLINVLSQLREIIVNDWKDANKGQSQLFWAAGLVSVPEG
jgi:hypothetical protein